MKKQFFDHALRVLLPLCPRGHSIRTVSDEEWQNSKEHELVIFVEENLDLSTPEFRNACLARLNAIRQMEANEKTDQWADLNSLCRAIVEVSETARS
jgi:hypothetical protein